VHTAVHDALNEIARLGDIHQETAARGRRNGAAKARGR
jgi:hypothetical protein